jgi:hypothetical protein
MRLYVLHARLLGGVPLTAGEFQRQIESIQSLANPSKRHQFLILKRQHLVHRRKVGIQKTLSLTTE